MSRARVAVIGGGIGGLTAAGELAVAGHEVTLFEGSGALGGKARVLSVGGVTLDTGPTLLTMPEVVRAAFARLGATDLLPAFHEVDAQCHYRWADGAAFTAWRDLERTAASADALSAGEGAGVRAFYQAAERAFGAAGAPYLDAPFDGPVGFLARVLERGAGAAARGLGFGTLDGLAARHFRTPHLRQFVGRFATYAGASPYEASEAFSLIPHLERVHGTHHVAGGMGALVRALGQAVTRVGVRVRLGAPASWTQQGTRFLAGPEGDASQFDVVVSNTDPMRAVGRGDEALALSGYVLLLEVDRRVALPHHLVLFSKDYRREFDQLFSGALPGDATLYVCNPSATEPGLAPPGRTGLFVMLNAPSLTKAEEALGTWAEQAARVRAQCLAMLGTVPELAGATLTVLGERTPADLARLGAPGGSIYGFLPHGRLGPFRRPRIRGPVPGHFFAGGGTHPGGGVPLVMMSGRFAAELAQAHLGELA